MSYLRIKWIKGHPYLYEQSSYRVGKQVKTRHIRYIGKYGYKRGASSGGGSGNGFIPPEALTEERKLYIDKELAHLKLGNQYPYEREILRQYLYHQPYTFTGSSKQHHAYGYLSVSRDEDEVYSFNLQAKSDNFTWMHELGHSLEYADKLIDDEIEDLRWQFVNELRQSFRRAASGDLVDKEAFIQQYSALVDIRRDVHEGLLPSRPIEERAIYQKLALAKTGEIPVEAFDRDFQEWMSAAYRLAPNEIFADSVASLILDPRHAILDPENWTTR